MGQGFGPGGRRWEECLRLFRRRLKRKEMTIAKSDVYSISSGKVDIALCFVSQRKRRNGTSSRTRGCLECRIYRKAVTYLHYLHGCYD